MQVFAFDVWQYVACPYMWFRLSKICK